MRVKFLSLVNCVLWGIRLVSAVKKILKDEKLDCAKKVENARPSLAI